MPDVTTPDSKYPLIFLRCRTIAFCAVTFFSFIWIILLCIVVFIHWETMDRAERSIILVMLAIHAITAIMVLVLLIRKFRAWLDGARIALLLIAQLGGAGAFAHYSPRFACSQTRPDDQGVCKLLILYILVTSWIVPALLLAYAGGLGVMSFHKRRRDRAEAASVSSVDEDAEKGSLEGKRRQHMSQRSSFLAPAPLSPVSTPVYSAFATPYLPPSRRASTVPTPTTPSFQSQYQYFPGPSRPPSGPLRPPSGPYRPPSGPARPPSGPYRSLSGPPRPPSGPPHPPSGPPRPPSGPPRPPSGPPRPPSGPPRPPSGPPPPPSPSFGSSLPNPYMMPPLPHHWNTQPISPNHNRHFSTTLSESIAEEASDTDSEGSRRSSGRLAKPSRTSRLPYLQ